MAAREIVQVKNLPYYDKQGNKVMDTPVENITVAKAILKNFYI
jgi:hypothetical protein